MVGNRSPNKLGELEALCNSFKPRLLAMIGSVQYLRVSLNFLLSCTLCVWMAISWLCKNWTFVASVRFVSWYSGPAHILSLTSLWLVEWNPNSTLLSLFSVSELSTDPVLSWKISKSSVDVDLSSLFMMHTISSVDVDILLVILTGGTLCVWLQSRSTVSSPLHNSYLVVGLLLDCGKWSLRSLRCSLRSESK